jgi:Ca-activated chloride channel family protein
MKRALLGLVCVVGLIAPATASAWSPLRRENSDVKKGNALMPQGKYGAALEAYDLAAEELPDSKGVQLNRGLALLAQGTAEQAKEAFLAAADPSAPTDTRADAYYDLGVTYARQGDALGQQEDHEQAIASFREAADTFKRSLRLRPGDRDAAWNFEYAMQRIREQEQNQDQDQQQDQDQEQNQDQDQQQDQDQEQNQDQDQQQDQEQRQELQEQPMRQDDVQRFLDALEQNEQSLPLQRARRQSAGRRPPEKDW